MAHRMTYLVGTVPLADAASVFQVVAGALGPSLRWLPDGETGVRKSWLPWMEPLFAENPSLERTEQTYRRIYEERSNSRYRLKPGVKAADLRFDNLPHARYALESWREFERLKKAGVIPEACRLQVDFAGVLSVIRRFIVEEDQDRVAPRYEAGLVGEIGEIAAVIPADQLAIQWDVASAVFQNLEIGKPTRYGETREAMLETFSTLHARLGDAVPEGVDLLYHLCYGDANHRHSVEPASTALLVEFSNLLSARTRRSIELIHMPVPRERSDDAYFAPLANLTLKPGTVLALGLVHLSDGVEGTRRRIAAAEKVVRDFAIGTECGFGRRPPETIPRLLEIHAEAAGLR